MSKMAKHAHMIWAVPTDDDVQARNLAVATLEQQLATLSTRQAIEAGSAIADGFSSGMLNHDLGSMAEKAISDRSAAFVLTGGEKQAVICLAVAALTLAQAVPGRQGGWSAPDALAASLWSALSFQNPVEDPNMEVLRQDVIESCRVRVLRVARDARERHDVPNVGALSMTDADVGTTRANTALRKAISPVVEALRQNQDLDREELDFLWWVLGDYSEMLDCPMSDFSPFCRAIASGLEGATLLRRLPSDGFRHAALRMMGATEELKIVDLIETLGEDREKLGRSRKGSWATGLSTVFPLVAALTSTDIPVASDVALDGRGWGARALLEASIIAMEDRATGAT